MADKPEKGAAGGTHVHPTPTTHEIGTSSTSPQQMTPPLDPIYGNRALYLNICVPLYQAALKGEWETARGIFEIHPEAVRLSITKNLDTVLHIAAAAKHTRFVEEMVSMVDPKDLELQNKNSNTAFCFAAAAGIVRIADVMLTKNDRLPLIRGGEGITPLHMAALLGQGEMVRFLYHRTNDQALTDKERIEILGTCISTDLYDVALDMLKHHPELAMTRDRNHETALHLLARKPSAFSVGTEHGIWRAFLNSIPSKKVKQNENVKQAQAIELVKCLWEKVIQLPDSEISDLIRSPFRLVFVAAQLGNTIFLTELLHSYPDLIWRVDNQNRSIFHHAVLHRQSSIFNWIYELGSIKDILVSYRDDKGNSMLHLAATIAPPVRLNIVSGAALQMQRELLWFKEVEKIMQPKYREKKNSQRMTPWDLFREEHKDLMKEGEKWMLGTASQSMLVATLITTVVFAAAFTVPGGDSKDTETPTLLLVFAISDGIALVTSSASILVFLSILTARYAEQDFRQSLSTRLMFGLTALFVSIITMMVTFTISFFIIFHHRFAWVAVLIAVFATAPVFLYASLQYPLLVDVVQSTYGSRFLFQTRKRMLYR